MRAATAGRAEMERLPRMREAQLMLLIRRRIGERRIAVTLVAGCEGGHVLAEQRQSPVLEAGACPCGAAGVECGEPIGERGSLAKIDAGESNVMDTRAV